MTSIQDIYRNTDAIGMAELVRAREVHPGELLEAAISRAEVVNPAINALCHKQYQSARALPDIAPSAPLGGVPFLLKDITTHVAGWPMSSGSLVFRDFVSSFDSTIVKRYRAAGLIFFGRTTSPEFGYGCTSESKLFGATRNPWNLALSSGGSSGGAAAAVAAGIVPVAQAGDAGGSIRIPAAYCGLFGLKPTRARTPAGTALASFLGFSTTHVISRSVRDSALLLDVTRGPEAGAPYYAEPPRRAYLEVIGADPGRLRIGLQRRAYDDSVAVSAECISALEDAARLCEELGHDIVETDLRFDHPRLRQTYYTIWPALMLQALEHHARQTGRSWRAEDLETHVAEQVERAKAFTAGTFITALDSMLTVAQDFQRQCEAFDIVISPTTAHVAPRIGVLYPSNPNRQEFDRAVRAAVAFTQIYNLTGQPAASVPLYWTDDGVPVGVQIAARYGDEATLLKLASQLEQARPWFDRRPAPFQHTGI